MTSNGATHGGNAAETGSSMPDRHTRHIGLSADRSGVLPVMIGTVIWAVALIALVIARDSLAEPAWIGAALVGVGSGLLGIPYLRHRARRVQAHQIEA